MTWKEIQPAEAEEGDRVRLGEKTFPVGAAGAVDILIRYEHGRLWANRFLLTVLGAVFEREVPDRSNGEVPNDDWTHIILGDGRHAVRTMRGAFRGLNWIVQEGRYEVRVNQKTIQEYADEHGFTVLWPRPEVGITDEMVERAAKAMCDNSNDVPWNEETDGTTKAFYLGDARAVLEAMFGTPGDGSTEHERDGIGICKRCGEGLTGLAVVDGEAPCSGSTGDA